jgi:hypothetical protein
MSHEMMMWFAPKLSLTQFISLSADRSNFKSRLTLPVYDKGVFKCAADTLRVELTLLPA